MSTPVSFKLTELLSQYNPAIENSEQTAVRDRLMKVLAYGVFRLNEEQHNALETFIARYGVCPNDPVVQLACEVAQIRLFNLGLNKYLKGRIAGRLNLKGIQSLPRPTKGVIAAHAFLKICPLSTKDSSNDFDILTKAVNLVSTMVDENMYSAERVNRLMRGAEDRVKAADTLMKTAREELKAAKENGETDAKLPEEAEEAQAFTNAALNLIKAHEGSLVPEELSNYRGYHGEAIGTALNLLKGQLKNDGKLKSNLLAFVTAYCNDHLQNGYFLIRNSSRAVNSHKEGSRSFTATVTWKLNGQLRHKRITLVEGTDGKPDLWYNGGSPNDPSEAEGYHSLLDLLAADTILTGPANLICIAPSKKQVRDYVTTYVKSSANNDESEDDS